MKKFLPFLVLFLTGGLLSAQTTFFDDFEAYNEGDYIGTQTGWSTWSGNPGGADDAQISTEEAYSGTNSLKLESYTTTGGPADVVLPMPYRINRGSLIFKFWIYVVEGTSAYFNFQGSPTPGQSWSAEIYFDDDGTFRIVSGQPQQTRLTGKFEHGKWFECEFPIDLTNNAWEAIIDGQCLGVFTNSANLNSVGGVDFYPNSANASNPVSVYFIDDVSYEISLDGLDEIELDASISDVSLRTKSLTGIEIPIGGSVRNNGSNEITSFEVSFEGGGLQFTESFDNVSVASGDEYEFMTQETYTYEEGSTDVSMSIASVNGMADQKTCNDTREFSALGVTPAAGKRILAEEATGTWCQWCPRGEVFVERMLEAFGDYFVPIAVHQGDPMENDHISWLRTAVPGFTGYPNMTVDRLGWFSFGVIGDIEDYFFEDIDDEVAGTFDIGAEWDGRNLKVSTGLNFTQNSEAGMSVDVILVEDNVTGTGPAYNQANAYAGGANGPMGGYENLPNPVPASQMVYPHTSRSSMSGFNGVSIADSYSSGDRFLANFEMNVPDTYDDNELYLVAVVLNADGSVNNVMQVSLQEAIDNGFEMTTSNRNIAIANDINVYPNPAMNRTFVRLDLQESAHVQINVINTYGAMVASRDYGQMSGEFDFPVDLSNLATGIYQIQIMVNEEFTSRTINVVK